MEIVTLPLLVRPLKLATDLTFYCNIRNEYLLKIRKL